MHHQIPKFSEIEESAKKNGNKFANNKISREKKICKEFEHQRDSHQDLSQHPH